MTKAELLKVLEKYPDDTPMLRTGGYDLTASYIAEVEVDDWDNSVTDEEGNETPGLLIAVRIGSRF